MKHREILEETERLILRRYVEEDLEDLLEYLSDGEVVKYEPYRPMTPEEAKTSRPKVVFVDDGNKIERITNYEKHGLLKDL